MNIPDPKRSAFVKDLEQLLNKHSLESGSDTPDFILAEFLTGCLETFNDTLTQRENWYGRTTPRIIAATPPVDNPPAQ